MGPTKAQFPKYTNSSYNSVSEKKKTSQSKNRQKTEIDISPKKT